MEKLVKQLYTLQADTYLLLIKTHGFHWNVKGMNFKPLHLFFEELYTEHFAAVDTIAEHIRTRGKPALASAQEFLEYSKLTAGTSNLSAEAMLTELVRSHEEIVENLRNLSHAASEAEDHTSVDLANQRMEVHKKFLWMIKAHLA